MPVSLYIFRQNVLPQMSSSYIKDLLCYRLSLTYFCLYFWLFKCLPSYIFIWSSAFIFASLLWTIRPCFYFSVCLIVPWPSTNIMTSNVGFTLAKGRPSTSSLLSNYGMGPAGFGPGVPVVGDPGRHRAPRAAHRQVGSRCGTVT